VRGKSVMNLKRRGGDERIKNTEYSKEEDVTREKWVILFFTQEEFTTIKE
jgi:hypothetical protein